MSDLFDLLLYIYTCHKVYTNPHHWMVLWDTLPLNSNFDLKYHLVSTYSDWSRVLGRTWRLHRLPPFLRCVKVVDVDKRAKLLQENDISVLPISVLWEHTLQMRPHTAWQSDANDE